VLIGGREAQSWLKRQHALHVRTVQPKELCGLVLIDTVKSICRQDRAPRPATSNCKGAIWFASRMQVPKQKAALFILWMYYCSRVLAAA